MAKKLTLEQHLHSLHACLRPDMTKYIVVEDGDFLLIEETPDSFQSVLRKYDDRDRAYRKAIIFQAKEIAAAISAE